jgi:hypothetical protein
MFSLVFFRVGFSQYFPCKKADVILIIQGIKVYAIPIELRLIVNTLLAVTESLMHATKRNKGDKNVTLKGHECS